MENNLKELRAREGIQQKEMADALGIAKNTFNQYENGSRKIPPDVLALISDLYKVSIDYILGHTDSPHGTKYALDIQLSADEEELVSAWRRATEKEKSIAAITLGFTYIQHGKKDETA